MTAPGMSLYDRLPEIYRIRDEEMRDEQFLPTGPLQAYLAIVEEAFGAIHSNIGALYDDLFIETAAEWVIPYIGDLLGTSHLSGDSWTLRADVADTIALRRRKGTLGAIELLTFNLTRWGVRAVELRENLVWTQHLNHQRPDIGGPPPYGQATITRNTPIRGGTIPVRNPALLSFIGTPFDPFGHVADVRRLPGAAIRYNLPNLAVFLWRLETYRVGVSRPSTAVVQEITAPAQDEARFQVRFDIFPIDRPVRLFNLRHRRDSRRLDPSAQFSLTEVDEAPGPIPMARLTDDTPAGNPAAYVSVDTDDISLRIIGDKALQLHLPRAQFAGSAWQFRGANLAAWQAGLDRPVGVGEIVIDPDIGRLVIGVALDAQANDPSDGLVAGLRLTWTYGAVGDGADTVGAHPTSRAAAPTTLDGAPTVIQPVRFSVPAEHLQTRLTNLNSADTPVVLEIADDMVHEVNLTSIALRHGLVIRAADGCRPIVRLARPLRFRPVAPANAAFTVRLEGLFVTRGGTLSLGDPLIARAAVSRLELINCTLDPGRYHDRTCTVSPIALAVDLRNDYGFANPASFVETPAISIQRAITGPLHIDTGYTLEITDSIIDGGAGVADDSDALFALTNATDPATGWGPRTTVDRATFFGRTRVHQIDGRAGIWVHALEVENNQVGCIKYSYFEGLADRLPQNHACVFGTDARLRFTSEISGDAAYGQLACTSDFRIRERGPGDDEMGAFGFLREAHRWRNLHIRYREFMPVGIRPLLIPVT